MSKIEVSNSRGRFTDQEIRQNIAESKKFWSSPAGQAEQRRIDQRKRQLRGTRFPELVGRGTKPALTDPLALRRKLDEKCRNF